MALIDQFVKTLFDQNADAIGLASGHPVLLMARGERKPIGPALEMTRVEAMLREVLPPEQRLMFQEKGAVEHVYRTGDGDVKLSARRANGGMQIMVVPVGRTGATPRGPISQEGAAAAAPASSPPGPAPAPVPAQARATSQEGAPVDDEPEAEAPKVSAARARLAGEGRALEVVPMAKQAPEPPPVVEPPMPAGSKPIDPLFREMVKKNGSDLYVCTNKKPMIRKDGDLVAIGPKEHTEQEVKRLVYSICPDELRAEFEERNDIDFAYEIPGLARFRANLFRDRHGVGGIFRQIPVEILSAEKLGLSQPILDLCNLNKGLVLVTGPTGSGKSTTLAAMIDYINRNRSAHIITIEDPIEFVHPDKRCVINQREVGSHTEGFKRALRAALREDPDIVLVGEMRDLETVAIAIETAETGHLVFGTLHTNTAASTVDRIIDQFPPEQQQQIRTMLAEALKGVISQTLCKRKGGGRAAALEVLLVTHSVSNLIREAKTHQLPSVMQTSKGLGMLTLNDALAELVDKGSVTADEAYLKSIDKTDFKNRLARTGIIVGGGGSGA